MRTKNNKMVVLTEGHLLLSTNELARLFGRSSGAIEFWTKRKGLPRRDDGKYDLKNSLLWLEKYLQSKRPVLKTESLDQQQLAAMFGVTRQKIAAWARSGLPRRIDKTYNLQAVCKWLTALHPKIAEGKYQQRLTVIEKKLRLNLAQCQRFLIEPKRQSGQKNST